MMPSIIENITSGVVFTTIGELKKVVDSKYIRKFVWVHPLKDSVYFDESEASIDGMPVRLGVILNVNNEDVLCIAGMGVILHDKQPIALLRSDKDFINAFCDVTKMYLKTINSPEFAD